MSLSSAFSCRLVISLQVICVALFLSLPVSAQVSQTLGALEVDRLEAAVYTLPISTPNGVGGVKPNTPRCITVRPKMACSVRGALLGG